MANEIEIIKLQKQNFIDNVKKFYEQSKNRIDSISDFEMFNNVFCDHYRYSDLIRGVYNLFKNIMVVGVLSKLLKCPPIFDGGKNGISFKNNVYYFDRNEYFIFSKTYPDNKLIYISFFSNRSYPGCISYKDFLKPHLPEEVVSCYKEILNESVLEANKILGYSVIKTLSSDNGIMLKIKMFDEIENKITQMQKYITKNSANSIELSKEGLNSIIQNYKSKKMSKILFGNNDFSKCFYTSEYLSCNITGNKYFDHTSIVCGYLKSFEIIIGFIYKISGGKNKKKYKVISKDDVEELNNYKKTYKIEGLLCGNYFVFEYDGKNTTLDDMISFVTLKNNLWLIDENDRSLLYEVFRDFKNTCRNQHFHTENIYNPTEATRVKNNALFCIVCLLGGCEIDFGNNLQSYNYRFDNLYKKIMYGHISPNFIIEIGEKEYKCQTIYERQLLEVDPSTLEIISPIKLEIVDHFGFVDDSNNIEKKKEYLLITKSNLPDKIYFPLMGKKIEVDF